MTSHLPEPDLVIRTSGEKRLSNFLLWQSTYSELYFTNDMWPEFTVENLQSAILDYNQRIRKFGLIQSKKYQYAKYNS